MSDGGEERVTYAGYLGLDKLLVYRYDADKGTLTPNDPPAMDTDPAAGIDVESLSRERHRRERPPDQHYRQAQRNGSHGAPIGDTRQ